MSSLKPADRECSPMFARYFSYNRIYIATAKSHRDGKEDHFQRLFSFTDPDGIITMMRPG